MGGIFGDMLTEVKENQRGTDTCDVLRTKNRGNFRSCELGVRLNERLHETQPGPVSRRFLLRIVLHIRYRGIGAQRAGDSTDSAT